VVVSSLSGKGTRALTKPLGRHERRWDYQPGWSPDGSQVAFARWTPKQLALMVVRSDGSGLRRLAALGSWPRSSITAVVDDSIRWSPDGSQLAFLVAFPNRTPWQRIYVAALDGSGSRQIAQIPKKAYAFFSLFGWTPDGRRVTYAYSGGESRPEDYFGPAELMTTAADGSDTTKVLTEDKIQQAAWLADGSLLYVRHCILPDACQLALRAAGSATSRPLTHFKGLGDAGLASEDDYLPFMQLPSGEVLYTHGAKIYDFSPTTNTTRAAGVARIPRRKDETCDARSHWVHLARISPDGRVALIELGKWCNYDSSYPMYRDYRFDLETDALTRIRLVTANPAQIYLP
jgi:hypothetical protein